MSLGANRTRTFFRVVLPLCLPGVAGGFILSFTIAISAYATPAILGGPQTETITTLMYTFMVSILDWSISSALGVVLVVSTVLLMIAASKFGARRASL